jgi:MipA family protein
MSRHSVLAARFVVPSVILLCAMTNARADDQLDDQASAGFTNEWHGNIGAGVMVAPTYPGASDKKARAVPVIGVSYNRFFFGSYDAAVTIPLGVGVYLYKDSHWRTGVAFSYDLFSPRKESDDSSKLHGMGDIERTAHGTLFASYTQNWLTADLSVASDVAGKDQGTNVKLGIDGKYPLSAKLTVSAGPSITWSTAKANQTYYGVDAAQSLSSGYARYSPSSGISDARFSAGVNYALTENWGIGARASVSYLPSNVSDSPIVGSRYPVTLGVFAGYRF